VFAKLPTTNMAMMQIFEAISDLFKNVECVVYRAHIRALMTVFNIKTRLMHLYMLTPLYSCSYTRTCLSPQGALFREYSRNVSVLPENGLL